MKTKFKRGDLLLHRYETEKRMAQAGLGYYIEEVNDLHRIKFAAYAGPSVYVAGSLYNLGLATDLFRPFGPEVEDEV